MKNPPAYLWFLPDGTTDDHDPIWRIVYRCGPVTLPVFVCAPDEDTAKMRAGMKRSALTRLDIRFGIRRKWEIVSIDKDVDL